MEDKKNNEVEVKSEVTVEDKVVSAVEKKELTPEERVKLEKQQQFFYVLRMGGAFIKFLLDDLKKQTRVHCNRASRRRIEKELKKGIITGELVDLYIGQIDAINQYFAETLGPKEPVKEVDGAAFYEEAKKAQEELNKKEVK